MWASWRKRSVPFWFLLPTLIALILNTPLLHAQGVRIFDDAPAARWIAPRGIPAQGAPH